MRPSRARQKFLQQQSENPKSSSPLYLTPQQYKDITAWENKTDSDLETDSKES